MVQEWFLTRHCIDELEHAFKRPPCRSPTLVWEESRLLKAPPLLAGLRHSLRKSFPFSRGKIAADFDPIGAAANGFSSIVFGRAMLLCWAGVLFAAFYRCA